MKELPEQTKLTNNAKKKLLNIMTSKMTHECYQTLIIKKEPA